jgi:hypothetical protein
MRIDWIPRSCGGYLNYYDHKDKTIYRADKCTKDKGIRARHIGRYKTKDDSSQPPFINQVERTSRCVNCANAIGTIRKREKKVKEFMFELAKATQAGSQERQVISDVFKKLEVEWLPGQSVPVIRSSAELGQIEKACSELSHKFSLKRLVKTKRGEEILKPFRFDGGRFQSGHKISTARPQDENNNKRQRLIGQLCSKASARIVRGLCPFSFCGEIIFKEASTGLVGTARHL